jgi:hypothetical protein
MFERLRILLKFYVHSNGNSLAIVAHWVSLLGHS